MVILLWRMEEIDSYTVILEVWNNVVPKIRSRLLYFHQVKSKEWVVVLSCINRKRFWSFILCIFCRYFSGIMFFFFIPLPRLVKTGSNRVKTRNLPFELTRSSKNMSHTYTNCLYNTVPDRTLRSNLERTRSLSFLRFFIPTESPHSGLGSRWVAKGGTGKGR